MILHGCATGSELAGFVVLFRATSWGKDRTHLIREIAEYLGIQGLDDGIFALHCIPDTDDPSARAQQAARAIRIRVRELPPDQRWGSMD